MAISGQLIPELAAHQSRAWRWENTGIAGHEPRLGRSRGDGAGGRGTRRSWLTRFTHDLLAPTLRPTTADEYPRSSSSTAHRRLAAHAFSSTGCPDFPIVASRSIMLNTVIQKLVLLKRHVLTRLAID